MNGIRVFTTEHLVPDDTKEQLKKVEVNGVSYWVNKDARMLPNGGCLLFSGYERNHLGDYTMYDYIEDMFNDNTFNGKDLISEALLWDGKYAVVYIAPDHSTTAFTDPMSGKLLYYDKITGSYSSRIQDLSNRTVDEVYRSEIAKWGYNTDERTPWKNVKRVMANYPVIYDAKCNKIWEQSQECMFEYPVTEKPLRQRIRENLYDLINTIPEDEKDACNFCCLLSGGLDSSVIAFELLELMKNKDGRHDLDGVNIDFYTVVHGNPENSDDYPYVELFEKEFGIKVNVLNYNMQDVSLLDSLKINEVPVDLGSMVPSHFIYNKLRDIYGPGAHIVVFEGDGSDGMFGGFRRILEYDSQKSDIMEEGPFYEAVRLGHAAEYFNIDLKCPFESLELYQYAWQLPLEKRTLKYVLKEAYRGYLPDEIIERKKFPLKNPQVAGDKEAYKMKLLRLFYTHKDEILDFAPNEFTKYCK